TLLDGMKKAGDPSSASWASLKQYQGWVGQLGKITGAIALPHDAMYLWDEFRTMCGFDEDGHKAGAMDRIHAAREVLEKAGEISENASWVLQGATKVLQKVGATAVSRWTGLLASKLENVPENIAKAIAQKLGPVIDKLEAIGGRDAAEQAAA